MKTGVFLNNNNNKAEISDNLGNNNKNVIFAWLPAHTPFYDTGTIEYFEYSARPTILGYRVR
jgi:hypothetical protein